MKKNVNTLLGPDDLKYLGQNIRSTMKYINGAETWTGEAAPVFEYAKMANGLTELQSLISATSAPQFYAVTPGALLVAELSTEAALAPAAVSYSAVDLLSAGELALKASGKIEAFLADDPFNTSNFDYYAKEGLKSFGRVDLIRHYDKMFNGN